MVRITKYDDAHKQVQLWWWQGYRWGASEWLIRLACERPSLSLPQIRQMQNWIKELASAGEGPRWRVEDNAPGDSKVILEVLHTAIMRTEGAMRTFSKTEAEWALRIRGIAPELSLGETLDLMMLYTITIANNGDTGSLDHVLVYRPWQSLIRAREYRDAVAKGWIENPGSLLSHIISSAETDNEQ